MLKMEIPKKEVTIKIYKTESEILNAMKDDGWVLLVRNSDDLLIRERQKKTTKYILVAKYHLNVAKKDVHKHFKPGEIFITDNTTHCQYNLADGKLPFLIKEGYFGVSGNKLGHWTRDHEKVKRQFHIVKACLEGVLTNVTEKKDP